VLQHATPACARTPVATLTKRSRRCGPTLYFTSEQQFTPIKPPRLDSAKHAQAIWRSLKSHREITASVTPATYFKRSYRNCPGRESCAQLRLIDRGSPDRNLTFMDTDLTNGRISSGLCVTCQEPHHICSIGFWVFARVSERGRMGSSRARSAAGCAVGPTLVTATPEPRW
jgi:hypothetical protein